MSKKIINIGYTNKLKYREGNNFVLIKTFKKFNHLLDYKKLAQFDFVPKLLEETKEKLVWEWIDGEHLKKPTDKDLLELARIFRKLHTSDIVFPKNNLRKRTKSNIKKAHELGNKWPEIENNYRSSSNLISQMSRKNPCHNDAWHQNILKDKNNKIWLVDWEYSTMGDKHLDLAFFIESVYLNQKQEKIFLDAYNSYDDYQAYIPEFMSKYKKLVNWTTLCWAAAQEKEPFPLDNIKKRLNDN